MEKIIYLILLLCCTSILVTAQCPTSSKNGVHIVQSGETLYRISKRYNLAVGDLCRMNNITEEHIIRVCEELKVPYNEFTSRGASSATSPPKATPTSYDTSPTVSVSYGKYERRLKASGGTHVLQAGESISSVAAYYGYTPDRLREMNFLSAELDLPSGFQLIVSEYELGKRRGETPSSGSISSTPSAATNTASPKTNSSSTSSPSNNAATTTPAAKPSPSPSTSGSNTGATKASASYMQSEELAMVDEINLVRSNPAGYVQYIEEYIQKIESGRGFGSVAVARELIDELNRTPSLSILEPTQCIYDAARKHGEDRKGAGSSDHVGTDGSWPWDRVLRECSNMTDGNENLVGGPSTVRESVIILLIDDGIPNRGHRKTMLRDDWKYVACYKVGQVGSMPNSWVQKYGK